MTVGLIGRKSGMTRIFTDSGVSVPVTVVEVDPNRVSQVKSLDVDGYRAIQLTAGKRRANAVGKSEAGHYSKAKVEAGSLTREFKLGDDAGDYQSGHVLDVSLFSAGQKVDVTGTSKGKGFAGAVKRHNFHMQDATHGNSLSHRAPGSIGQCQTPGRVWKGKKMAGQMGSARNTVQSLEVVRVDVERQLIMIKGALPGAPGSHLIVQPAVKG